MTTRREKVILELDSNFARQMAKDAAAAELFKGALHGVSSEAPSFSRTAITIERDSARVGSSIDKLSGRLHLLVQSAAALGPALIPVATAAVPAIAGLTTELGFGVAAAGTFVLAFQHVGDTLDALNKAQLEPTEANIKKLREEASHLSPAARELVIQLDEMAPAFAKVRSAGSEGLMPGVSDSLENIESLLPRVSRIVRTISDTTGELLAAGSESLAGPEWEDFFQFLDSEARPTLITLGKTVGNLTKGLVEMWMAFDPLSDDFTGGLLDASEAFESWAESLSESQDFQEFVEYIRETGPQVLETLGDIGNMFLQIAEAAAPLGGPTLEIIGMIADIIASIADSDLGTPIMTAVAALSAMRLVLSAVGTVGGTAFGGIIKGQANAVLGLRGLRAELELTRLAYLRTGDPALLTKLSEGAEKARAGYAALGKGAAAAVGGIAVLETGLAQTKTAIFALTGAMVGGGPGAVAGGLIGATLDVVGANDDLEGSLERTRRALGRLDFAGTYEGLDEAKKQLDDFIAHSEIPRDTGQRGPDLLRPFTQSPIQSLRELKNETEGLFGDSDVEEERKHFEELAGSVDNAEASVAALALAFGNDITPIWAQGRIAAEDWIRAVERATPAMIALRISAEDLANATPDERHDMAVRIARWTREAESAEGRTRHFAEAVKDLGDEELTTAQRADALADALDGLFDPKMNLDAALNNWKQGLQSLKAELDTVVIPGTPRKVVPGAAKDIPAVPDREVAGSRKLFDDSEGALQNQDVIRERVELMKDALKALAEAGGPNVGERVAKTFRDQREALLDVADAAGLSREEVNKYLTKLGYTPQAVRTLIETLGLDKAESDVDRLNVKLDRLAHPRIIKVTVQAIQSGDRFGVSVTDRNDNGIPDWKEDADGGTVPKTGLPYADRHRYLLADGEEVISNRYGQADRHRDLLKAINAGRLADGGTIARSVPYTPATNLRGLASEIAPLLARLRPAWGPVTIEAHNINDIRREYERDAAMAMSDGMASGFTE